MMLPILLSGRWYGMLDGEIVDITENYDAYMAIVSKKLEEFDQTPIEKTEIEE